MLCGTNPSRRFVLVSLLALWSSALIVPDTLYAASSWKPSRPVEIVVPTSPGGGVDALARTLQKIIQDNHLVNASTAVVNKPGGGGAIGYAYLNSHPGDGQYLAVVTSSILTNQITGVSPFHYTDVTPIANMGSEHQAIVVRNNSPFTSVKSLIEQLKKDPRSLAIAVASRGSTNHIAFALAMKAGGVDVKNMKIVIFKSGGESTTALLGGHVDVTPASASVFISQVRAGKVRALAVTSPRRLGGVFADVPTLKEQGIDVVFLDWRLVIGPRGMTEDQVAYWERVLLKVTKTHAWQKFLHARLVSTCNN